MTITTLCIGTRSATSYASIDEADDYLVFDASLGEESFSALSVEPLK